MASVENTDVLIIGTGPSGSSTALHLLQQDPAWAKRIIMVDKAVHPREKLCGGGITHLGQHILARLGLTLDVPFFEIKEARLYYKNQSISFYGDPVFRIVRRDEFDHWLVQTAEKQGVNVRQGEAVKSINYHDEYVEVVTSKSTYHAQILVGADGSKSFVRRSLKLDEDTRVARLIEVLTPENASQRFEFRDAVAVFDFTAMTEGNMQGYYWDFPSFVKGKPFMNRGVFDSRTHTKRPKADLKNILHQAFKQRERNLDDYKLKGHPIRWWDKNGQIAASRVILVGDAAGADPFVGEGISFALGHGPVAAAAISEAFAQQDFTFATYQERVLADPLIQHLTARTRLARLVYLLNSPIFMRLLWFVLKIGLRRSRWADPSFAPDESPQLRTDHLSVIGER
jgi:geranylgeranyl reductase family protein